MSEYTLTAISSRISALVASLEHHPLASSLIPLVDQFFFSNDIKDELHVTTKLREVCRGNSDLLFDLWTLRGFILLEDKQDLRALSTFWEGLQFCFHTRSAWQRVIDAFIPNQDLTTWKTI